VTPAVIFKIVPESLWREAVEQGVFTGSPIDQQDGFIHFSTGSQVRETAAKHFARAPGLLLVAVSTLGLDLRWEPSRGGDLFPHLYGPLPLTSVPWVKPLPLDADGSHIFPALDPAP